MSEANGAKRELERRKRYFRLRYFEPYDWQREFCNGLSAGGFCKQIALIAANQTGKTMVGSYAVTYHATGLYPDWWKGRRFRQAPLIWVGGNTIPNTRDLLQAELLGEPGDKDDFGSGSIPKHLIGRPTKYHGIPDALQSILVKHTSGRWSKIIFKAFEQGKEAWMGKGVHYIWPDEEVPYDIYSQCLRATVKHDGIIGMTFTPENGMTPLVRQFFEEIKPGQLLVRATWDDAPHLSIEARTQRLASMLPYERDMRAKGLPVMGSGLIFPISEDKIMCNPFTIPDEWPRIAGIDFAGSGTEGHPTALVVIATDPQTDISYIYDTYRESGKTIPEHWLSMKRIGDVPISWPHDGAVQDRGGGGSYSQQYRDQGANMLERLFTNPPIDGQKEGSGGRAVKPGLTAMYAAMKEGQFKVFSNQTEWFEEFRNYYMKPNKSGVIEIVKEKDDLMSATRYAFMCKRHAANTTFKFGGYMPESDYYQDSAVAY